eukprot:TRINITY_DN1638_c0_g1_i4.p1 TRINITY_DN1638_c0_g1~~TRINITY_DN1638_c0_g1_i4.p1  ORF type:complete len:311 (-),score=45.81 TRINITY_DN1638_c0_g1_i4:274-1206(-)
MRFSYTEAQVRNSTVFLFLLISFHKKYKYLSFLLFFIAPFGFLLFSYEHGYLKLFLFLLFFFSITHSFPVARLRKRHGVLKRKLGERAGTTTVKGVIMDRAKQQNRSLTHTQMKSAVEKIVLSLFTQNEKKELTRFSEAYRLAGKTLFKLPNNLLGLKLETSYGGQYGQSYFVVIEYDSKQSLLKVKNTSLPYFIPTKRIEEQFLNKNVKTFSYYLSKYVNAYVSRQQQFFWLKDNGLEPECTESFDYAKITLTHNRKVLSILMIYDDISQSLPTRVTVTEEENKKKRYKTFENALMERPIPEVWPLFIH